MCLQVRARGMPPQPHPPVAEGAWLRPRPTRQSPDCRRRRVHRQASRHPARVRLTAAAFPAQHIRSALSQCAAGGAAHRRLRSLRHISGSGGFLRGAACGCGAVCRRPARSEYLPSPDRRHLACLRPRLPPSPPPPRAAAPPARSAIRNLRITPHGCIYEKCGSHFRMVINGCVLRVLPYGTNLRSE